MRRAIATITTTVQVSLTVVDEAKFSRAYDHWAKTMAIQSRPTHKAFFMRLSILAQEGDEAPAKEAGCTVYWVGNTRGIKTKLSNT